MAAEGLRGCRGRSFSYGPNMHFITAEAKSMFSLLRDEYENIKQMPLIRRYREMERVIEMFTADDVVYKLAALTRDVDKDGVMLATTPVEQYTPARRKSDSASDRRRNWIEESRQNASRRAQSFSFPKRHRIIPAQSASTSPFPSSPGQDRKEEQASPPLRQKRNGIFQNMIKSDEIPEFQIPPKLDRSCQLRRLVQMNKSLSESKVEEAATSSSNSDTDVSPTVARREYSNIRPKTRSYSSLTAGSLRDSVALPGAFINKNLSMQTLNIDNLESHVTEGASIDFSGACLKRKTAISICQEKHLQELDLASLESLYRVKEDKLPEPGLKIRMFVFEHIVSLKKDYEKLRETNVLIRYWKMTDLLENCVRSCKQLKI